jgi:hypothetical protein
MWPSSKEIVSPEEALMDAHAAATALVQDAPDQAAQAAPDQHWYTLTPGKRAALIAVAAALPVVFVNTVAFIGQFAFVHDHVDWILPGQVLFSATLESIAVYLAWHAHLATMKNDSALRLKLSAYGFAAVIGLMNYSHYADHWKPTFMAVAMFLMSAASPWLWGVHTRRASRDKLMERGLVEEHSVRLGITRISWHPYRSFIAMQWATWSGENRLKAVLAHFADRWPDRSAPARADQPVPDQAVQPGPDHPVITAQTGHVLIPGTELNGAAVPAVHHAVAELEAEPSLPVAPPELTDGMIRDAELYLAGLPDDQLPGERTLAEDMLGYRGRRREARRLLARRRAAGQTVAAVNPNGQAHRDSVLIATPVGHTPGGGQGAYG